MYSVNQMIPYNGILPSIGQSVFLAYGSKLIGDVFIGNKSSIWFNCVLRGDVNYIRIGEKTNIQDGTVVHVSSTGFSATGGKGSCTIVGNNVTVGHNATIHACHIKDYVLVGMGSTILDGAVINEMSLVAAGALITPRTIVKSNELWAGNPAKCIRKISEKEKKLIMNTPEVYSKLREEFLKK